MRCAIDDLQLCVRQFFLQPLARRQRHQGVVLAVQQQRGQGNGSDFAAQIDVAQPVKAGHQRGRVGQMGGYQLVGQRASEQTRLHVALIEQDDKALQRAGRCFGNGIGEAVEQGFWLGVRPVVALRKAGCAADQDEFFEMLR